MSYFDHASCISCGAQFDPEQVYKWHTEGVPDAKIYGYPCGTWGPHPDAGAGIGYTAKHGAPEKGKLVFLD